MFIIITFFIIFEFKFLFRFGFADQKCEIVGTFCQPKIYVESVTPYGGNFEFGNEALDFRINEYIIYLGAKG